MNEMTLPSRHRIRNSSKGDLRLTTLPLGNGGSPQYFVSLKLEGQSGVRTHDLLLSKQAALTTAPGPPP